MEFIGELDVSALLPYLLVGRLLKFDGKLFLTRICGEKERVISALLNEAIDLVQRGLALLELAEFELRLGKENESDFIVLVFI